MSDDRFIILSWSTESPIFEPAEPDELLYEASGNIHALDVNERRSLVGKFRTYYVDAERAINGHVSIFDVFDTYSHTVGYFEALFGRNFPEFSNRVTKLFDFDVFGNNVLILDRIELLPKYRGKGLGLKIMRHMMRRFGAGAGIVAIKPFPLQFEHEVSGEDKWRAKLRLAELPKNERLATKQLSGYYSKLGFRRIGRTPYMVANTSWVIPEVEGL